MSCNASIDMFLKRLPRWFQQVIAGLDYAARKDNGFWIDERGVVCQCDAKQTTCFA